MSIQRPIIMIDGSYYCFHRFHSLLTWWKNAHPEDTATLENPYSSEIFVDKFRSTFIENIKKIERHFNPNKNKNKNKNSKDKQSNHIYSQIIVGKDCKRQDIWRNEYLSQYKNSRKNDARVGDFFKLVYTENLFQKAGVEIVLEYPQLEADDCISLYIRQQLILEEKKEEKEKEKENVRFIIITSDKDYLQLACQQVEIYNLSFKNLTEQKSSMGDATCDLFCKIVMGDTSDNIPAIFPKCGPKGALKYYNNPTLFQKKLKEKDEYRVKYTLNTLLVDFNSIPESMVYGFMNKYFSETI